MVQIQRCLSGGYAVLSDEMEGMPKRPKGPFGPLSHNRLATFCAHVARPFLPFLSGSLSAVQSRVIWVGNFSDSNRMVWF